MGNGVVVAKKSPNALPVIWRAAVELHGFKFGKLIDQRLVDHQSLIAVRSGSLVLMLADALLQKLRHLEIRIAQQGRHAHHRSQHLCKKRTATIANQQVGLLLVDNFPDQLQRLLRVARQIGSQHHRLPIKSLAQSHRHSATPRSKKTMQKNDPLHHPSKFVFQ